MTVPVANGPTTFTVDAHAALNSRELDYLARLAMNESRKAIAAKEGIDRTAVDHVIQSAMRKLGTDSLIEAFRRLGWLKAGRSTW